MRTLTSLIVTLAFSTTAFSENWARYRGENGSGISKDSAVPLTWSSGENIKWKTELPGPGSSSPIVWEDRVYLTCFTGYGGDLGANIEDLKRHLIAIDRNSGEIVWKYSVGSDPLTEDPYEGFLPEHGYASNTPVTDGERIYCFFGKGGVAAVSMDGKELWKKNVGGLHSQKRWGSASSPILLDGKLIVKAGDESRALYAFDAKSGEEVWKAEGSVLEQTYGTPAVHKVSDDRTDLIVAGTGEVWGVNPDTGKLRWFSEIGLTGNISSSPVINGNTMVLFGGFPRTMGVGLKLGLKGDATESSRLWENVDVKAYMTAPLFHDGKLYFIRDEGIACCADPEKGELIYEERLPFDGASRGKGKPFYASPILVNGHIVAVSRTSGTFVIEAKPEFNLVRTNVIDGDDGRFQGTPAVSGGNLFLRSETAVYCVGE